MFYSLHFSGRILKYMPVLKTSERLAKITLPLIKTSDILPRKRLFKQLDQALQKPITFVIAPCGSGKTTLVADYIRERKLPCLWYQLDEGEADLATFFHYLRLAASNINPRKGEALPLLTFEYLQSVNVFARGWFEKLFNILTGQKPKNKSSAHAAQKIKYNCIALDNYQDVPEESAFHEMLAKSLEVMPEGMNIVIISRNEPHTAFARLKANSRVNIIGRDDIRFTLEETKELVSSIRKLKLGKDALATLHKRTEGWAAGLIHSTEIASKEGFKEEAIQGLPLYETFDYFAGDVFNRREQETQRFLLETSFLPRITPDMADRLTGMNGSDRILSWLSSRNYFTQKYKDSSAGADAFYQYYPLFRAFLLNKAKSVFAKEEISRIQRSAAKILTDSGQIEDAVGLYTEAMAWEECIGLICAKAPQLFGLGRTEVIRTWIEALPASITEQTPYLLYWRAVCTMAINPAGSRAGFEKAYELFKAADDRLGMLLAWSGIADTSIHEMEFAHMDRWIAVLDSELSGNFTFPSAEFEARVSLSVFNALAYRQPQQPKISSWEQKAFSIMITENSIDINARLFTGAYLLSYYAWIGTHAKARLVLEFFRKIAGDKKHSDLNTILMSGSNVIFAFHAGRTGDCLSLLTEALKLADETGVHIWDNHYIGFGLMSALSEGDIERTDKLLQFIKGDPDTVRSFDIGFYHNIIGWWQLLCGDIAGAYEHLKLMLPLIKATGFFAAEGVATIGMVEVLREKKEFAEARQYLAVSSGIATMMKSRIIEFMCLIEETLLAFDEGDNKAGLVFLEKAMKLGREQGYANMVWWRPKVMAHLCLKALEANIEVEYVQGLIRNRSLVPDIPLNPSSLLPLDKGWLGEVTFIENWPYPVKIYTLGRFEILIDCNPIVSVGKAQQKPLQLLKILIAFGGSNVPTGRIIDVLWPDAEGDMAANSLDVTLLRLRKLLGSETALQLTAGSLSIYRRYCWVDIWAVEGINEKVNELSAKGRDREELELLINKALEMYKGPFLPNEIEAPYIVSARENLKREMLRLISRQGQIHAEAEEHEKAVMIYERGLELDDNVEELYQHLMQSQTKLGRKAEAIKAYKRCCSVLESAFGCEPSEKTEVMYRSLIKKG